MKSQRHAKILEIINENEIETQEDLLFHLKKAGFNATQATISRDIKELRLSKRTSESGKTKYVEHISESKRPGVRFETILSESVISVDYAGNICVIKCHTGLANAACAAIDALGYDEQIVGTIAGDDTIFILLRSEERAREFASEMKEMYRSR